MEQTNDKMWDLLEEIGVEYQTLQIVTAINGYTVETMKDILFAYCGYRSVEQMADDPYYEEIAARYLVQP